MQIENLMVLQCSSSKIAFGDFIFTAGFAETHGVGDRLGLGECKTQWCVQPVPTKSPYHTPEATRSWFPHHGNDISMANRA